MPDLESAGLSAHRANIDRYHQLLGRHLSARDRRFILQRLAEEQAALERLARRDAWFACPAK